MHVDHELLSCVCARTECPVYAKCCVLPTECNPDLDGKISLLFVGQGGGKDERKLGRPFIGRAGKRIRQQVLAVRKHFGKQIGVAFSNTIRDNPDGNRIPSSAELEMCLPFLYKDIASLKSRGLQVVIPLGNAAKSALIKDSSEGMSMDRGRLFKVSNPLFGEILMMPTYHPSYVMRNFPRFTEDPLTDLDFKVIQDIIHAYEFANEEKIEVSNE